MNTSEVLSVLILGIGYSVALPLVLINIARVVRSTRKWREKK